MFKTCRNKYKFKGFTLIEVIIVVSIIALLSTVVLYANIRSSLEKARDSKRKQDLSKLVRIFEDYYNDSLAYPRPNPGYGTISGADWGMEFPQYNITLPKDPLSPSQTYYYDSDLNDQTYFVLYAKLENKDDGDIILTGCKDGCGPNLAYNYALHSSNVQMIAGVPNSGQQGGGGGGGGGGGCGTPIPTPTKFYGAPTPTGPLPTFNPVPPVGCSELCGYYQCCAGCWCGDFSSPPGVQCTGNQYCYFESQLDPYGYPYAYVPNIHHQYVLLLQNMK